MNTTAKATIDTPVGVSREIMIKDSLKQGTVTGPDVCKISMDSINNKSLKHTTFYGPELDILSMVFYG